ncbi:MAG: hypothetical protein JKX98_05620 [Alcanivoracaceae bacterium]|nr:hypothetical protein [Alcanivoracaceae bacterium]
MRYIFTIILSLMFSSLVDSANWSRYVTGKNTDNVIISFRQLALNNAWAVEWYVKNGSDNWIEAVLTNRRYICNNDSIQNLGKKSLGFYLPHVQRTGDIRDINICPNSKIKIVEIETEIHEASKTSE